MNPETKFRELLSKLLDGEFNANEREELARLCDENDSFRETLRAELELDELIRHAASEFEDTAHHFSQSLEARISGDRPDFDTLKEQLVAGELTENHIDELVRHCRMDEEKAVLLCRELKWADLLEQASTERRSEEAFLELLKSRISRELTDFSTLKEHLIEGEASDQDLEDLVRHCRRDEENAAQLRRDLNWGDLLEQASAERRSEEAFIKSLESRISGEGADFDTLKEQLVAGELAENHIDELVRHCRMDEEKAVLLCRELKWADLLEQASTERRSEEAFLELLKSRISRELTDFSTLKEHLIEGEASDQDLEDLVRHCRRDEENAAQLRRDLNWGDLLEQASAERRSEEAFIKSLESRISGEGADFDSLTRKLVAGEAADEDIDDLVRHCWREEENAIQLGRELKWADLLEQASTEGRSEDAFIESLATRMWAEQEQDHFVEQTRSKIVSLYPEAVQPAEPEKGSSKVISIGTWATAAAAVLALGAIFLVSRPDSAVAEIVHATKDVQWTESPRKLDRLSKGHYQLDSGVVTLKFANGAEMTIEGPAEFDLGGGNQAFVHSGIAMLDQEDNGPFIAPGSSEKRPGFTLQSRGLNLIDTDDTIGIDARSASSTEAVVFHGGAEVCLPSGPGSCRNLYEYEAVRIDLKRDKIFDVPYNPRVFARSWEVLAGVEDNTGSVRIELPGEAPLRSASGDEKVQLFVEGIVGEQEIEVDSLDPGQFASVSGGKGKKLAKDRKLRSYLLQLWPEDSNKDNTELEASVTFSNEVVGVIYSSERLQQSDSLVGSEVVALGDEISPSRGLDSSETESDSILLSDDLRTVNLRLQSGSDSDHLDHVRVLVALR